MSRFRFTVISDLNKYTEHILYAQEIISSSDKSLLYTSKLNIKSNFEAHKEKISYLKQYVSTTSVDELVKKTEQRIKEFGSSKAFRLEQVATGNFFRIE